MHLREALDQIAEIRQHLARTEVFRGFRARPTVVSAAIAVTAALTQALWLPAPANSPAQYVLMWVAAAVLCLAVSILDMAWQNPGDWLDFLRCAGVLRDSANTPLRKAVWVVALQQLAPCLVAGALVTAALARRDFEHVALLPGLWQILFGLGILACHRQVARELGWVGLFYLASGGVCLAWLSPKQALSPLTMGLPFCAGQIASAIILYVRLERDHG